MPGPTSDIRPLARSALDHALAKAISMRVVVTPILGSLALTFAFFEPARWRKAMLAAAVLLIFGLSLVEWLRYRRHGLSAVQVPLNVLLMVLAQLVLVTASGGLFSPAVPAVPMLTMVIALLGERRTLWMLLSLAGPWIWTLAFMHHHHWPASSLLPELYGGAQALERGPAPWVAALLITVILGGAARVGTTLQTLFNDLFRDAVRERDHSLSLHADQARTLTLLTSEIAHELKNPLASLRGLGALVAKDVEGRTAERVRVLRGEVDRMQVIIDDFLNLSRPLVPLNLSPADLGALCRDVVRLLEGVAEEHGVRVTLHESGDPQVTCDAKKVRQVLINLLQNAMEASPRGSAVKLRVEPTPRGVTVTVIDQGAGLSQDITARAFEPFVTSKPQGSGMGLVVARSLARQHGGDVVLAAHPDGGLVAELTLPCSPVQVQS